MSIDHKQLVQRLSKIADRYAVERSQTKSVARTIAKAKQEAILEAIEAVTLEIGEVESDNPWRYFTEVDDPEGIRMVRRGCEGTLYHRSGDVIPAPQPIEWYEEDAKRPMPFCREVTEAQAAAILGGKKPWEENTK